MKTYKFTTYAAAISFKNHAKKIWMLVLSDDGYIWAVTPARAAKLERQGYEVIA